MEGTPQNTAVVAIIKHAAFALLADPTPAPFSRNEERRRGKPSIFDICAPFIAEQTSSGELEVCPSVASGPTIFGRIARKLLLQGMTGFAEQYIWW